MLAQSLPKSPKNSLYSSTVVLNPNRLFNTSEETPFKDLVKTYDEVFSPCISGYNGKSGTCMVEVNIGPNLPPQPRISCGPRAAERALRPIGLINSPSPWPLYGCPLHRPQNNLSVF